MKRITLLILPALIFMSCKAVKKTQQNVIQKEADTSHSTPPPVRTEAVTESPAQNEFEIIMRPSQEVAIDDPAESTPDPAEIIASDTPQPATHLVFNNLLTKYVTTDGVVNYKGLKKDWAILRTYIKSLEKHLPSEASNKEEKIAYWMNAYNAMTIDLILRNFPIKSIKDIKDPWDQRLWKLKDKWYNLNEIEHKILRKMGDARIHFGINCASFSCPPLLNKAFTANEVDNQLEALAINFVNDSKRNNISADHIEISKIFTWFGKDFKTEGTLIDFLNKYATTKINPKAKKKFKTYNWALNN